MTRQRYIILLSASLLALYGCKPGPQPTMGQTAVPPPPPIRAALSVTPVPPPSATPIIRPTPAPTHDRTTLYGTPGDFGDAITSGEARRRFKVHIPPSYQPGTPMPLVLCFHGGGGTMAEIEEVSRMSAAADQVGFIAVYPQAAAHRFNPPRWRSENVDGNSDVAFIRELIQHLESRLSIDAARIFATGYSNGATFSDVLGCQLSGRVAAIGPVVGGYADPIPACRPQHPVSAVILCDTRECPPTGEGGPNWAPLWVARNNCDPTSTVIFQRGNVTARAWGGCDAGTSVVLYAFDNGGHTWFEHPVRATDVILDFFASLEPRTLGAE